MFKPAARIALICLAFTLAGTGAALAGCDDHTAPAAAPVLPGQTGGQESRLTADARTQVSRAAVCLRPAQNSRAAGACFMPAQSVSPVKACFAPAISEANS